MHKNDDLIVLVVFLLVVVMLLFSGQILTTLGNVVDGAAGWLDAFEVVVAWAS